MEKIKIPKIKGYAYKTESQCNNCIENYRKNLEIKIKVPAFCLDKYIEFNNKNNYLPNLKQIQTYFMSNLNFKDDPKITKQVFYNILNKKLIFHFYCIFNTINIYTAGDKLILESILFAYPEIINNNEIQCFQKTSIKPQTITSEYYSYNLKDYKTIISKLNCNSFFGSWTITTTDNNYEVNSICDVKNIENLFNNCGCYEKLCDPNFLPEFLLKLLYLKLCPQQS